jgi:hypothetical protein
MANLISMPFSDGATSLWGPNGLRNVTLSYTVTSPCQPCFNVIRVTSCDGLVTWESSSGAAYVPSGLERYGLCDIDYDYIPVEYCVSGLPAVRTSRYANGTLDQTLWTRTDGTVFVPTVAQIAAATFGACASTPAVLPPDYEFVDGQYCVAGLPANLVIPFIDGVRQPQVWSRLGGAIFVPTPAQLSAASLGECPFILSSGGVSIANGTNAVNLGPDGTSWSPPVGVKLKSVSVCVRKGATNNAVGTGPGAVNDRVQVQSVGMPVGYYMLQGECRTWAVTEDQDELGPMYVYTLGNTAASVTYTYGAV